MRWSPRNPTLSVRGRTLTSWPSLQTDLRNAGATWVDQEVAVPRHRATDETPHNRRSGPVVDSDGVGYFKARCHPRAILMYAIEWACVRARKLSSMIASGSTAETAVAEM